MYYWKKLLSKNNYKVKNTVIMGRKIGIRQTQRKEIRLQL